VLPWLCRLRKKRGRKTKTQCTIPSSRPNCKTSQHLGSTWDSESWKRLLVDTYTREIGQESGKVIPNLTGDGIVQLGLQTRKFTKAQASEFTEWLMAWAAQNGVTLHD
jgi:hypothetical protein